MRIVEKFVRNTNETQIKINKLNVDGKGEYSINLEIGFLKHMLELFSKHSGIDIFLEAKGDIEVDYHHTVEDIGICLGKVFRQTLGDITKLIRYGYSILPMDESLVETAVDICNRPVLVYNVPIKNEKIGNFDIELIKEFFEKFVLNSGICLHINLKYYSNVHHGIEAVFKSVAKSIKTAIQIDETLNGSNSTKGML